MPSRQRVGGELYRYAYQGQEKDTETDKEAFQLRLWDGRIGRWLTTDPYGQFSSPYMGMGNNPISLVDPDGGCVGPDCIEGSAGTIGTDQNGLGWTWDGEAWNTNFSIGLNEVNISAQGEGGNGIDADDIWVGATGTYLSTVGNVGQNAWWWKDAKECTIADPSFYTGIIIRL